MEKKTAKNVVEEWVREIRRNATEAYNWRNVADKRDTHLQRIIGNCDAILATLDCCKDEE